MGLVFISNCATPEGIKKALEGRELRESNIVQGLKEALQIGLINRVVSKEELMPAAWRLAERICENGPVAVQAIKEAALRCLNVPVDQAFVLETYFARKVFATEDAKEGPKAFVEKRKPEFKGR